MRSEIFLKFVILSGLAAAVGAGANAQAVAPADLQKSCPATLTLPAPALQPYIPPVIDKSAKGEMAFWNKIKNLGDATPFLAYVANFPKGMFVDAAIEKYRQNCGDLSALPPQFLSCVAVEQPLSSACHPTPRISLLKNSPPVSVPDKPTAQNELNYWNAIKQSDDPSVYLVYINKFPNGTYFDLAVENYKRNCGDLGALPLGALTCQADLPPASKLLQITPVPPPTTVKPPIIKVNVPPTKPPRRNPPVVNGDCSGTTFASLLSCSSGGVQGGNGRNGGSNGGNTGGTGGGTTGQQTTGKPPVRPSPPSATGNTPVPVSPPVAAP